MKASKTKNKSYKQALKISDSQFLKLAILTALFLTGGSIQAALSPNIQYTATKATVANQTISDGSQTWGINTSYGYWQAYGCTTTSGSASRYMYTTAGTTVQGLTLGSTPGSGVTAPSTYANIVAAFGAGTVTINGVTPTGAAGTVQVGSSGGTSAPQAGAIVIEQAVGGGAYTFSTAVNTVSTTSITLAGVADPGDTTFAAGTYGIEVVPGAAAPTFTNAYSGANANITLAITANQIWQNAGTGNMVVNGNVNGAFTLTTKGAITFGSANNSIAGLTVATGTTTFAGGSAFQSAATTVNSGATLDLGGTTHSIGTGALTLAGGTIQNGTLTASSYALQSGTISGSIGTGNVTKTTSGTVNMTGANSGMTGTVGVSAGTLEFSTSLGSGAVTVTGGTLQYDGTALAAMNGGLNMSGGTKLALIGGGNGGLSSSSGAFVLGAASSTTTISLSGVYPIGNYTLINTTGTGAITTPGTLQFSGSTLGGATVDANGTTTVGRTTYQFTTTTGTAGNIKVAVSGGGLAINWNGGASGTWDNANTGNQVWTKASDSSSTSFYNNDNPTFGSGVSPTVTVASGGVAPATTTFAGNNGDVATITNAGTSSAAITNQVGIVNSGAGKAVLNASISGSGGVTNSGAGEIDLNNANTYTGGTTVSGGKLVVGNAAALGSGTLGLSGGSVVDLGGITSVTSGNVTVSGGSTLRNGTITAANYYLNGGTVSASLGAGAITVGNSTTTTLSGSATAASGVTIQSGATLALGASSVLPSGSITVPTSATLNLNGYNQSFNTISGAGAINSGTGTLTWGIGATTAFTGVETIATNGAIVITNGVSTTIASSLFAGTGTLVYSPSGNSSSSTASKTVTLTGLNTAFTGTTLFDNALVNFSDSSISGGSVQAFGTSLLAVSNGTLLSNIKYTGSTAGTYSIPNAIYTGASSDQFKVSPAANTTFTLSGVVSGSGTLSQGTAGTVIIGNANNTFAGGFINSHGVTQIANGAALGGGQYTFDTTTDGSANGILHVTDTTAFNNNIDIGRSAGAQYVGEIDVDVNKTFTIGGNILNATNASYSGFIPSGGAGLTKGGTGVLVLNGLQNGGNTYTGATTVSSGTLAVNTTNTATAVTVASAATLAGHGGSVGAVIVNGSLNPDFVSHSNGLMTMASLTLNSGSTTTLDIEDVNASAGTGYDQIVINGGALAYNGTLNITSTQTLAQLFGGASQSVVLFSGMSTPTGDLTAVEFNAGATWTETATSSGIFTYTDGVNTYSFTDATGTLAATAVPEPGTCAMVGLGLSALAVTIIRRRRND
jgi:autotransporter-associated beta strand protein